jgi:hypothetical protein
MKRVASPARWAKRICVAELAIALALEASWGAAPWGAGFALVAALDLAARGVLLAGLCAKSARASDAPSSGLGFWGWGALIARGAAHSARTQWLDMGLGRPWSAQRELALLESGAGPVAIVAPGYACGSRPARRWAKALREEGFQPLLFEYSSAGGCIDGHAAELADFCERARQACGCAPWLVGHSMGGLCALAAAAAGAPAAGVVAVATPLGGTATAGAGFGEAPKQMALGAPWLEALRLKWLGMRMGQSAPALHCLWTPLDAVVSPASSAMGQGWEPVSVEALSNAGHLEALSSSRVARQVARACAKAARLSLLAQPSA